GCVYWNGRGKEKADRYKQRHCRHERATSPSNHPWLGLGTLHIGFWGVRAGTTGRATQVSCSVGGDGITQQKQKSRALRGGDLRSNYYPVP
ncbi:hypothetical protein BGU93_18815, partial [Clostridioides difficile]